LATPHPAASAAVRSI